MLMEVCVMRKNKLNIPFEVGYNTLFLGVIFLFFSILDSLALTWVSFLFWVFVGYPYFKNPIFFLTFCFFLISLFPLSWYAYSKVSNKLCFWLGYVLASVLLLIGIFSIMSLVFYGVNL